MGIWIRSQNKMVLEPMNISGVRVSKIDNNSFMEEPKPENIKYFVVTPEVLLGEYLTETEAIRVLDMIETHIVKVDDCHRTGCYEDWIDPIFHMPEAGFYKEV